MIPIRAFVGGQDRLADALDDDARAELGRELASRVLTAAAPFPVVVVTSAPEVRDWALVSGATAVIDDPGSLDAAARAGVSWCRERRLPRAIVAHADLPWARSFGSLANDASRPIVVIVPCHRDDGTPVLSVPTDVDLTFAYGAGSFRRHAALARDRGLAVRVLRDPTLAFDVDIADDLTRLGASISPL